MLGSALTYVRHCCRAGLPVGPVRARKSLGSSTGSRSLAGSGRISGAVHLHIDRRGGRARCRVRDSRKQQSTLSSTALSHGRRVSVRRRPSLVSAAGRRGAVGIEIGGQPGVNLVGRRRRVHPPFCAPDAPDPPAETIQYHLAQAVAIASGRRAVIGGAVAFDASEVTAGEIRMHDAEIDSEERHADLGMDFPSLVLERPHHGILERRFRCAAGRREGLGDGARAVLGEFQEMLEVDDALGAGASEVDLLGTQAWRIPEARCAHG